MQNRRRGRPKDVMHTMLGSWVGDVDGFSAGVLSSKRGNGSYASLLSNTYGLQSEPHIYSLTHQARGRLKSFTLRAHPDCQRTAFALFSTGPNTVVAQSITFRRLKLEAHVCYDLSVIPREPSYTPHSFYLRGTIGFAA